MNNKEAITIPRRYINKYVNDFTNKNISTASNITFTISIIVMVLLAASYGGHSINSKAEKPNSDTIFYRINTTIRKIETQFWRQGLRFLREKNKKLKKVKCYVIVDETYDSYTGRLTKKAKKFVDKLTNKDKKALKYIHKYKPKKGCTGSYKYLVFALVYGNRRRVLRVKALREKEEYKSLIIKTLLELRKEVSYECVLFDRGFYDGLFIQALQKYKIPFIVRAKISKTMRLVYGFYHTWKCHMDFEIGEHKIKCNLVLGVDFTEGKRSKWAFITNIEFDNWYKVREIYRKRWNIENIFKATDGIQLKAQTNDPTIRLFCVCLSFLFYNAWQEKNNRKEITLTDFVMQILENIFEFAVKTTNKYAHFFRDKLKIKLPFWQRITSSL